MENVEELTEVTAEEQPMVEADAQESGGSATKGAAKAKVETKTESEDFATQFARWAENPLVAIAIADPRLCRFIGDLLAGEDATNAAWRNFPKPPAAMPDDVAQRMGIDEATMWLVEQQGRTVMEGWSDKAVEILLRAVAHDDDVRAADEQGYIRGRNSAIEALRRRTTHSFNL